MDDDDIIRPLYIILPQMSGYIKCFDDGGKNMSFKIEDDNVCLGYIEIWNKIKKTSSIRFHSNTVFQTMKFQNRKIITFVLQQYVLILS